LVADWSEAHTAILELSLGSGENERRGAVSLSLSRDPCRRFDKPTKPDLSKPLGLTATEHLEVPEVAQASGVGYEFEPRECVRLRTVVADREEDAVLRTSAG
jgi:hypothetical protein